jgi:hypothetical protein
MNKAASARDLCNIVVLSVRRVFLGRLGIPPNRRGGVAQIQCEAGGWPDNSVRDRVYTL